MLAAWLSCVQLLAAACDRAEDPRPEPDAAAANARALLIAMGRDDQHVREGIDVQSLGDSVRLARMAAVDSVNTARLAEIVRAHGWPGKSRFGEEASHAAFLIVQHSTSPEFQKSMLELLSAAAVTGEAEKRHVAMLTDRVLTNEDEPQRYGTQFRIVDGRLVAYPIDDPAGLDARRAAMGLAPMSEYMRVLRESYGGPVQLDSANVDSPPTSAERAPPSRPPPVGGRSSPSGRDPDWRWTGRRNELTFKGVLVSASPGRQPRLEGPGWPGPARGGGYEMERRYDSRCP